MKRLNTFAALIISILPLWFVFAADGEEIAKSTALQLTQMLLGATPEPKQVYLWTGGKGPFSVSSDTVIVLDPKADELIGRAAALLQEDMEALYGLRVPVERRPLPGVAAGLLICNGIAHSERAWADLCSTIKSLPDQGGTESCRMAISPISAGMISPAAAGVFYGAQTLRQMLRSDRSIPSLAISDWPDQAIRACYGNPPGWDIETYVRKLARLKINMALCESSWSATGNWWYNPTGKNLEQAKLFFKLCRDYNIEPVPFVQGFGWSYGVVGINPNCSEGLWVQDERHTLRGTESVSLDHANVIRTAAAPIIVTDGTGNVRYREGKDYAILPGITQPKFAKENKPWSMVRLKDGGIRDGQEIRVDYNYMTYCDTQTPHCPSEPLTYEIVDRTLENVIRTFKPRYIHIGHDEVRYINRCRRCRQSGLTSAELASKEIRHWYETIKRCDRSVKIMMWSDLLKKEKFEGSVLPTVPADVIVCPWIYGENKIYRTYMANQMDYFAVANGRPTFGACTGYSHRNIWAWKEVAGEFAANKNNLGFMFCYWGDGARFWSALSFSAEYMWSRNKIGEAPFDLYASADNMCRSLGLGLTLDVNEQRAALAKQADLVLTLGGNVLADGTTFSGKLNDIATKIKACVIPDLAISGVAVGTVPERILTQIEILPAYYLAMGKYLEAQRAESQGNGSKAKTLLAELLSEFKQRRFPGYASADKWGAQYKETGRFPLPMEVFGVELKRPSPFAVNGISLPMASLETMVRQENERSLVYDLQVQRSVHALAFAAVEAANYFVSLSTDGKSFDPVDDAVVTRATDGKAQTILAWPPKTARWVRLHWDGKTSAAPSAVEISVVKEPMAYLCMRKAGGDDWAKAQFWKGVPVAEGFVTREKDILKISRWQTRSQAVYDDENLYVRFECPLSDPRKLIVNAEKESESATQIWENDCVQFFVRTRETTEGKISDFHQVIVNSAGNYMTKRINGTNSPVDIQTRCEVMPDKWVCCMAIPLRWLEVDGKLEGRKWGVNFCRTKHDPYELASWAVLPQGLMSWFHQPDYFGTLTFESERSAAVSGDKAEPQQKGNR